MSRNAIVGAVVVVIGAIAAVIWTQSAQAPEGAVSQPAPAEDVAPTTAVDTAVQETQDAAESVGAAAQEAVEAATEAAEEATSAAVEAANEAVSEAVESVTGAGTEAAEAASGAVAAVTEEATAAVSGAVEATQNAVGDAVAAVTESTPEAGAVTGSEAAPDVGAEAATGLDLETLLTPDGFDVDAVLEAVAASDLGGIAKTALSTVVEQVRDNPDLTESVIAQVKQALGL